MDGNWMEFRMSLLKNRTNGFIASRNFKNRNINNGARPTPHQRRLPIKIAPTVNAMIAPTLPGGSMEAYRRVQISEAAYRPFVKQNFEGWRKNGSEHHHFKTGTAAVKRRFFKQHRGGDFHRKKDCGF